MSVVALVLVGAALLVTGIRGRERRSVERLVERLDLPFGEADVSLSDVVPSRLARASALLIDGPGPSASQPGRDEALSSVLLVGGVGAAVGLVCGIALGQPALGGAAAAAVPLSWAAIGRRRRRRVRDRLLEQVPGAMAVLATSLESGATLDRSLALVADRADPPLQVELQRLVAEVELGADLADAVENLGTRLGIEDLRWWAFALRVQASVGGPLAPITRALSEVMSHRADLRREAQVLTAEGRLSAYVLGAMPLVLLVAIQAMNPGYLEPFFEGWGPVWLASMAASVLLGIQIILRMVKGPGTS